MDTLKLKAHIRAALTYFILAAILGVILRAFQFIEIPIVYKFVLHTHSHIALLGWVYLSIVTIVSRLYVREEKLQKQYSRIYWFTQITLLGMLFTFPFMGYALFSIVFSTLFLFASYWFTWFLLKNTVAELRDTTSFKCIKMGFWYLLISSAGPWALGAIMNVLGPESIWYRMAIYFYLHFLYNGWMMFSLVGLLFYLLERKQLLLPKKTRNYFLGCLNLGIVLSFFLSTLFATPPLIVYIIGGLGAVLQLIAFAVLAKFLISKGVRTAVFAIPFHRRLLTTVFVLCTLKLLLQLLSSFPYFARLAVGILDFTIGYLHLTFLGLVSIGLFLFLDYFRFIRIPKWGYYTYLVGFLLSELTIVNRGISAWLKIRITPWNSELIAASSMIIVLGLLLILGANSFKSSKKSIRD